MSDRYTETCSCGASIEFTIASVSYAESARETLRQWRGDHRHVEQCQTPHTFTVNGVCAVCGQTMEAL